MLCDVKFTVLKRRHHCRACGKVLCNKCCNMKYRLEYQGNIDSRVCVSCFHLLTKGKKNYYTYTHRIFQYNHLKIWFS
ncbi:Zinc finger FYVE domain-containing protein 16 [Trachymyrmex cornetzi]|uniref:Zinc finger FYVE domain-containing protein 16 n=1 Tax=Trachymyrmex cornetzi TaxID=471704 RepID=A0A151J5Y8_9HYME|nr:Zinc finger FYVE domain-containing protein 16 [Trachymyrmex cornetzi]